MEETVHVLKCLQCADTKVRDRFNQGWIQPSQVQSMWLNLGL